jgi:hypothetical protein
MQRLTRPLIFTPPGLGEGPKQRVTLTNLL